MEKQLKEWKLFGIVFFCAMVIFIISTMVLYDQTQNMSDYVQPASAVNTISEQEYNALESELKIANAENDSLKEQLNQIITSESAPAISNPEKGIQIYDDEYVTISFLGIETGDWMGDELVFYAINKTDADLSFQADTLAINGENMGNPSGSDTIAAKSKGKFKFTTEEPFPSSEPETLSGTIRVIDFSNTLFGEMSYNVKLVDILV